MGAECYFSLTFLTTDSLISQVTDAGTFSCAPTVLTNKFRADNLNGIKKTNELSQLQTT